MKGNILKNIDEIIKSDFKSAFSNPIVVIVLIGIIILPSLYAVLNIYACWDPYGNTDEVVFAIANLDNGSTFKGDYINIGNELVTEFKNNNDFKWTFVSEEDLRTGVFNGTYYAGIVIPKNLSENVVSIATDNPKQAKLEYVVNVKTNPVASKLTDSAANRIYMALNAKIVKIIDLAAYEKLGELQKGLASGSQQLSSGGYQLQSGSAQISSGSHQVSSGAKQVKDGKQQVSTGAETVKSKASDLDEGAQTVQEGSNYINQKSEELQQGSGEVQAAADPSLMPDGPVKDYVDASVELANGSGELAKGSSQLANGSVQLANGSVQLANGSVQLADGSVQLADGSVQLADGSVSLAAGAQLLSSYAVQALFTASSSLGATANELGSVTGINKTLLGNYLYAPIALEREEMFSVPDYGSDIAPFYIVLSMWVGAILTCVMLKTGLSTGTKYSALEMYGGKLVIFVILSILQACVTIIGCNILGIHIVNLPLFIFSCILVSAVFMILVYSIISALGQVGKAIAVVLLVLQISATGGIYPIQIMHGFFQTLYSYMPMTFGITLVREAQLGTVWSNYWPALAILLAIGIITVIVALLIKVKADKASHYFEKRLEESGLF